MKVYQGEYLNITFEKQYNRFVQFWSNSPDTIASFKAEMLIYTNLYKVHKPKQSLWLQQNFTLQLDLVDQNWIENHVNKLCKSYGNEKLAFVVSEDILAHISVIDSFEEINSCIIPKHFATEKKARTWLNEDKIMNETINETSISFEGVDEEGYGIIKFKSPSSDINKTIGSFKNLIEAHEYIRNNLNKYITLTKREKQILHLYTKVHKINIIADQLHISLHTARTHWRNIKSKLRLQTSEEILIFAKAFDSMKIRN